MLVITPSGLAFVANGLGAVTDSTGKEVGPSNACSRVSDSLLFVLKQTEAALSCADARSFAQDIVTKRLGNSDLVEYAKKVTSGETNCLSGGSSDARAVTAIRARINRLEQLQCGGTTGFDWQTIVEWAKENWMILAAAGVGFMLLKKRR